MRDILGRVAPIMSLIAAAAATDPEIAAQWPAGPDPRYTVQHAAAKALTSKPDARPDVDTARAADLLYGLLSPELYLIFVRDRGWSPRPGRSGPARPSPPTSALITSRPLILRRQLPVDRAAGERRAPEGDRTAGHRHAAEVDRAAKEHHAAEVTSVEGDIGEVEGLALPRVRMVGE
ncbi:hypothetical protein ACGFNV_06420 [Streptomyces sp. NPDC048751]|uniref:hypothetical protein n=1 Tax=Streptomyces sp. NPDC048751 TaxID=3365591 RepID=UPI003710890C